MKGCAVITARNKANIRFLLGTCGVCSALRPPFICHISHFCQPCEKWSSFLCWRRANLPAFQLVRVSKGSKVRNSLKTNKNKIWWILLCYHCSDIIFLQDVLFQFWFSKIQTMRGEGQVRQHVVGGMICCYLRCCQRLPPIRAARDGKLRHLATDIWNCSSESHKYFHAV